MLGRTWSIKDMFMSKFKCGECGMDENNFRDVIQHIYFLGHTCFPTNSAGSSVTTGMTLSKSGPRKKL